MAMMRVMQATRMEREGRWPSEGSMCTGVGGAGALTELYENTGIVRIGEEFTDRRIVNLRPTFWRPFHFVRHFANDCLESGLPGAST